MRPEDLRICAQPQGLTYILNSLCLTLLFSSVLVQPMPDPSSLPESSEEWLEKPANIGLLPLSSSGPSALSGTPPCVLIQFALRACKILSTVCLLSP